MESHIGCDDIEFWTRDDENFLEFGDESLAFQSPRKVPSILTSGLGKFQCEMSVDIPCGRYFSAVDEDDIPFSVHPFSNGKRILYMVCRGQTFTHREERQVVNFVFFRGGGQLPPELLARESTPGAPHEAARNGRGVESRTAFHGDRHPRERRSPSRRRGSPPSIRGSRHSQRRDPKRWARACQRS